MKRLFILIVIALHLGGCSESTDGSADTAKKTSNKVDDHVWQDQTDALQKAKDAEKLLEDAQMQRKQQIDDAVPPR